MHTMSQETYLGAYGLQSDLHLGFLGETGLCGVGSLASWFVG